MEENKMNVKELFENEELMNNIVEDIEDIPEDSEVTYEVWALGYDKEDNITDVEFCLESFDTLDSALTYLKSLTLEDVFMNYGTCHDDTTNEDLVDVAYFTLEIETVVNTFEGTTNLGTACQRDLWIDGEYGSEEDVNHFVSLSENEFEILEDNTVKVRCELLKDFNKNDLVRFYFPDTPGIDCQIVSKVIYADGDYYHCEMMF
jgi:hypothetical protein